MLLETLHERGHMLQNAGGLAVEGGRAAARDLGDGLQQAVLVAEVGLDELVQAVLLLDDGGAVAAARELGEQADGRALHAADRGVEHLDEEADAVQVLHDLLVRQVLGQDEQGRGARLQDVEHVDVVDLEDVVGGHVGARVGSHLDLGVGVEQDLHELLDDTF